MHMALGLSVVQWSTLYMYKDSLHVRSVPKDWRIMATSLCTCSDTIFPFPSLNSPPFTESLCMLTSPTCTFMFWWANANAYPLRDVSSPKQLVLIFHDESSFHSNGGRQAHWHEKGKMPLKPKDQGKWWRTSLKNMLDSCVSQMRSNWGQHIITHQYQYLQEKSLKLELHQRDIFLPKDLPFKYQRHAAMIASY